jgi:hypothetical protein
MYLHTSTLFIFKIYIIFKLGSDYAPKYKEHTCPSIPKRWNVPRPVWYVKSLILVQHWLQHEQLQRLKRVRSNRTNVACEYIEDKFLVLD